MKIKKAIFTFALYNTCVIFKESKNNPAMPPKKRNIQDTRSSLINTLDKYSGNKKSKTNNTTSINNESLKHYDPKIHKTVYKCDMKKLIASFDKKAVPKHLFIIPDEIKNPEMFILKGKRKIYRQEFMEDDNIQLDMRDLYQNSAKWLEWRSFVCANGLSRKIPPGFWDDKFQESGFDKAIQYTSVADENNNNTSS